MDADCDGVVVQVCAHELGIPISKVHLSETATNTVANTSATAASVSSGEIEFFWACVPTFGFYLHL